MIGFHRREPTPASIVPAAIYGALLGLVIACAGCYILTRFGMGLVGGRGDRVFGPAVFARSGLNLYAVQHVPLVGTGEVTDALGNTTRLTASITLPLTVWAAVPALALALGGYAAARAVSRRGRGAMTVAALGAGLIYAVVLAVGARWVGARLDTFLLPEVGGFSANPPQIVFRPLPWGALCFGGGFGVVFARLGAALAVRELAGRRAPTAWWACAKAVLTTAAVVHLLIAVAVLALAPARPANNSASNPRIVEMLPTAAGLGYAMLHGATLISSAESRIASLNRVDQAFRAEVSVWGGLTKMGSHKPTPAAARLVAVLVGVVTAFAAGRLAARWGSRDGSVPTALRAALIHTCYILILPLICGIVLKQADAFSSTTLRIQAHFGPPVLVSFAGVLAFSMLGAHTAGGRRRDSAL